MTTHYHRYILTTRESAQWHHCNTDIQRWRQRQIDDKAALAAKAAGHDC